MHDPRVDLRDHQAFLHDLVGDEEEAEVDEDLIGRRLNQGNGYNLHRLIEVPQEPGLSPARPRDVVVREELHKEEVCVDDQEKQDWDTCQTEIDCQISKGRVTSLYFLVFFIT